MSTENHQDLTHQETLDELKTSRFDRHLSIAKTSLNLGRRWAGNSVSGLFLSKEAKEARKQDFLQEQANYLVSELGKLKGSVVKIGQMLALYGEHMLPPEITQALQSLNDNTATLSWSVIESTLKSQLKDKFDDFDINPLPIGTASLAQVHRATIKKTGQQVVLKVQYPGVADAIDSDLSLFKQLLKVTNVIPQTRALDTWFEEIRDLLHHEVNYLIEATTTERFYQRLKDDSRYVVPQILPEYSTNQVLCMSYEEGVPISSHALQQLSQERRDAIGQAAINIMIQEIFVWGEMQTDPNFGNYLVRLDETHGDKLVLLDFGAVRQFDEQLLTIAKKFLIAGFYHDKHAMMSVMEHHTGYAFFDTMSPTIRSDMADIFLLATEPFSHPDHNHSLPASCLDEQHRYLWANSQLHTRLMKYTRQAMQSKEFNMPPKELMFISRKFIGAYTFLTVLNARTHADDLIKPFIDKNN